MRMNIQKHFELSSLFSNLLAEILFHKCSNQFNFSQSHFGLRIIISKEASIHVLALSVAPIVTGYDTVWVHLWQYPELQVLTQLVGKYVSRKEEIDETMDNEAGVCLARVLATNYNNGWLVRILLFILICNFQHWKINSSIALANAGELNERKGRSLRRILDLPHMRLQLCICIWYSVCYIHIIFTKVEFEIETTCII